jgi:hypothetical protein
VENVASNVISVPQAAHLRLTARTTIRAARADDADAVWAILEPVIRAGDSYALPQDLNRGELLRTGPQTTTTFSLQKMRER